MNAAKALRIAREAGVTVGVAGNKLTLKADAKPSPSILELLARHKSGVIDLLRPLTDGWSIDDWIIRFDELAGSAEFEQHRSRTEATAYAHGCLVTEWLDRNPVRSPQGHCVGCGQTERKGDPVVPFGTDAGGRAWLHSRCWRAARFDQHEQR
jgi:hypothetical protein